MRHVVFCLLATMVFGASAIGQIGPPDPIELTAAAQHPVVSEGAVIPIILTIKNTSAKKLRPVVQDRDANGQVLPYPAGLTVMVKDSSGRILTENDVSKDEWWSWYYTWPQVTLVRKDSKNRVTLRPGKQIVRTVDLATMLGGAPSLADGLPGGVYTVQFSLNGVRSNEIQLEVEPASRPRRTSR